MKQRARFVGPVAVVVIVVAMLAGYFGAYYALCEPDGWSYLLRDELAPKYRYGEPVASYAFYPAHQMDRTLWPERWTPSHQDFARAFEAAIWEESARRYDHFINEASLHLGTGNFHAALASFTAAIDEAPGGLEAYIFRGQAHQLLGNWQAAMDDYEKARDIDPGDYDSWNNMALLLAACPDDSIRDGANAVAHAQRACEQTEWNDPSAWRTLAIAYAELGDWQAATDICDEQLGKLDDGPAADEFRELQKLFRQEKPYRLEVVE